MKKAGVMSETLGGEIEWVKADLLDPKSMSDAIAGCTHVIHVASPVPGDGVVKNDKQMIEMAVTGMKTILQACKENKVQKLIVTSSSATINGNCFKGDSDPNYSEEDFSWV
jgi:nucleoside-diphosphate-sugar epimerase